MPDKLSPVVLVIEPDVVKSKVICNAIERYWFSVVRCPNYEHAERALAVNHVNMVIISTDLGGIHFKDVISKLRALEAYAELPVIIVVEGHEINQLDIAEDDLTEFLQRPFDVTQLMILIKTLLRKSKPVFQDKILQHRNIKMDLATFQVYCDKRRVRVGPTEFKILQLLLQSPKKVFARSQIIDYVWGTDANVDHRTIDVHINRLRTMLHYDDSDEPVIKTVRSAGYCITLPSEEALN
jgi:two-component system phosphate regulon response regulator PhoB